MSAKKKTGESCQHVIKAVVVSRVYYPRSPSKGATPLAATKLWIRVHGVGLQNQRV